MSEFEYNCSCGNFCDILFDSGNYICQICGEIIESGFSENNSSCLPSIISFSKSDFFEE